jgi:hypothetical protein
MPLIKQSASVTQGPGFFVDIVLLVVVGAGAWLNAQGNSTPTRGVT